MNCQTNLGVLTAVIPTIEPPKPPCTEWPIRGCKAVGLPDAAIGKVIDFFWLGQETTAIPNQVNAPTKTSFVVGRPDLTPLPSGIFYNPIENILYFPDSVKITSSFAIWNKPESKNQACGGWVWTAEQICVTILPVCCDDEDIFSPQLQHWCLRAVANDLAQALTELKTSYAGQGQIFLADGTPGQLSSFTFIGHEAPYPLSSIATPNLASGIWTYGLCSTGFNPARQNSNLSPVAYLNGGALSVNPEVTRLLIVSADSTITLAPPVDVYSNRLITISASAPGINITINGFGALPSGHPFIPNAGIAASFYWDGAQFIPV